LTILTACKANNQTTPRRMATNQQCGIWTFLANN
jgi:hypothetical protein